MKRKWLLFVSMLVCVIMLISGCNATKKTTSTDTGKNIKSRDLRVAAQEIPYTLNPLKSNSASHLRRIGAAEALFKVDKNGQVLPEIAEKATEIDATTWEIKLKPKVTFWSGKPVNADAVIASLEQSKVKSPQAIAYLKDLKFLKIDDNNIQVKTTRKHMQVPLNLSCYQTVIQNTDVTFESVETMDLTGMYKVVEYQPKQKMVLEINNNYWGQKPTIRRIIHTEVPDDEGRTLLALSGDADIVLDIPVTSISKFKNASKVMVSDTPEATSMTIYLNLKQPQLQDVKVRQALSWGLDRKKLVLLGVEGKSAPITTWLGANPDYPEAKNAVYTNSDPNKAASLLDEAGWKLGSGGIRTKDGRPLTVRLLTWGTDKALGEAIQYQWTQLGVKAEVQHVNYDTIEAARKTGDWDASIEAWGTYGDPYTLLSGQFSPIGSANYGRYDDAETNALLGKLAEATTDEERHKLALQINEKVAKEAPVICLYPRPKIKAISKSLDGYVDHFRQFEFLINADMRFNK